MPPPGAPPIDGPPRPRPAPPGRPPRPPPPAAAPCWPPIEGLTCLGIIAGFGRGMPPLPPGRGMRPSPERGAPPSRPPDRCWVPPLRRAWPMPWDDENGLFPGRGAPGRRTFAGLGPGRGPGAAGLLVFPGAGVRRGPGVGRAPPGDGCDDGAAGRCCEPPAEPDGLACGRWVWAGLPAVCWLDWPDWPLVGREPGVARGAGAGRGPGVARGPGTGGCGPGVVRGPTFAPAAACGASGCEVLAAAGFGLDPDAPLFLLAGDASDDAPPAAPFLASLTLSVTLRTTGASIVEDAERTNSPISFRVPRSSLLSIPSSLASS